jgi:hypothetical protein
MQFVVCRRKLLRGGEIYILDKREKEDMNEDDYILFEPRSQDGVPRIHDKVSPTLNTAQGGSDSLA